MSTRQEIIDLMNSRGFVPFSYCLPDSVQFVPKYMYDSESSAIIVNVFVECEEERFKISWQTPRSINVLTTPFCSPITDDEHFNHMLVGLLNQAEMIRMHYPTER